MYMHYCTRFFNIESIQVQADSVLQMLTRCMCCRFAAILSQKGSTNGGNGGQQLIQNGLSNARA